MAPTTAKAINLPRPRALKESIRRSEAQAESCAWADNNNRRFTEEEDLWLLENRNRYTKREMAEYLGRTFWSVRSRLAAMDKADKKNESEKRGAKKMAIRLKAVMEETDIGLRQMARDLRVPVTNLSNLVNRGELTKKDQKNGLKKKIEAYLREKGVGEEVMFTLWLRRSPQNERNAKAGDKPPSGDTVPWEGEMISEDAMAHFRLKEDPFDKSAVASSADLMKTPAWKRAASVIEKAISRKGFCALWGDVGAGKTLLWTELEERLGDNCRVIRPEMLEKERLTVYNLQEAVIRDLKAEREDYIDGVRGTKEARDRQIRDLLRLYDDEGMSVVLLIEEAHVLPLRTIRALKRLHEIQHGFSSPLSIVLLAQSELKEVWQDMRIREVTRRCRLVELKSLRQAEIPHYIRWKFQRTKERAESCFTDDGLKAVGSYFRTGAPPLAINNFCAHLLNQACELQKKKVDAELVQSVR